MKLKWTDDEIFYVMNNYKDKDIYEMSEFINRTPDAIYTYLKKINIFAKKHKRKDKNKFAEKTIWTKKDIDILNEYYPYYSNKEMCEIYLKDKTPDGIRTMANKNGIKKVKVKSSRWYNDDVMLIKLKEFSDLLGRTPTHIDVQISELPSTKTYERRFGTYSNACILAGLTPNYSEKNKGCASILYSKNKDICFSNSELIITNFLIDNGIEYQKEVLYSDYFLEDECNTKRVDWVLKDKTFVEFCGYPNDKGYMASIEIKKEICNKNNFEFMELYRKDLIHLKEKFSKYLSVETM